MCTPFKMKECIFALEQKLYMRTPNCCNRLSASLFALEHLRQSKNYICVHPRPICFCASSICVRAKIICAHRIIDFFSYDIYICVKAEIIYAYTQSCKLNAICVKAEIIYAYTQAWLLYLRKSIYFRVKIIYVYIHIVDENL